MKIFYKTLVLTALITLTSCSKEKQITNKKDYVQYLSISDNELLSTIKQERSFWTTKLNESPNQFLYLAKIARAESNLFENTGNIKNLINAEQKLIEINTKTNYNNASYLRMLSKNYISQHKFNEALLVLKKAELNGEDLLSTQKMLFDVYLELGNTTEAQNYLSLFENESDFDYLIRLSKWSNYQGNLSLAIFSMKKATKMAEQLNNKNLMQWSYTNLADFLGHANQIKASYNYYLKALEINPHDSYAKKGIAWIVYSYERNPTEALHILNNIGYEKTTPDHQLLKAEIYEFMKNENQRKKAINSYVTLVENKLYGAMYNSYNIDINLDEFNNIDKAIEIAKEEIKNRPTPQSYDLLAWSYFKKGNLNEAVKIIDKYVINKTSEPEVLYHIAKIYKANNHMDYIANIKKELLDSSYELGPIMEQKINKI